MKREERIMFAISGVWIFIAIVLFWFFGREAAIIGNYIIMTILAVVVILKRKKLINL